MDIICKIDFISVFTAHWLLGVIVSFAPNCLREVCGVSKMVGTRDWLLSQQAQQAQQQHNKYTKAAWLLALLIAVPIVLMRAVSVPNVFLIVIDVTLRIFSFVCLMLIPSISTSRLILEYENGRERESLSK